MVVKKQHYVPRFYLKNFTSNPKQIGMYNFKNSRLIPKSNLYNQCCKDFFYDKDNQIENSLAEIEKVSSDVIKKIITDESLGNLSKDEHIILDFFVSIQRQRTVVAANQVNGFYDLALKETYGNQPDIKSIMSPSQYRVEVKRAVNKALAIGCSAYSLLLDMKVTLLINESGDNFLTSDHPVIFANPLLEKYGDSIGVGFATIGLMIIFPISSSLCLVFYDSESYHLGRNESELVVKSKSTVKDINKVVLGSAGENAYFDSSTPCNYIKKVIASCNWKENKCYGKVKSFIQEDGSKLVGFSNSLVAKNIGLNAIITIKKSKKKWLEKLLRKRHSGMSYIRNPTLYKRHGQFDKLVKEGIYNPGDFFVFLDDFNNRSIPKKKMLFTS